MTGKDFTSYAQNFEDVMLWRALKSIAKGFYVDVGANHPEWDSVTKAFYDRGWRGINVEADASFHQLLLDEREEDRNVCTFVGKEEGELEFFHIPDSGLSTFRKDFAEQHREAGWKVETSNTKVRTLTSILEEAGIAGKEIHFLKIDVEGAEADVLRGLDLDKFRPWIVVVEATEPNSTKETHQEFEPLLLDKRYSFAYFDGLSRFYIADEKSELADSFRIPPNVFDGFEVAEVVALRERVETAEKLLSNLDQGRGGNDAKKRRVRKAVAEVEVSASSLFRSRRWRWGRIFSPGSFRGQSNAGTRLLKGVDQLKSVLAEEFEFREGNE